MGFLLTDQDIHLLDDSDRRMLWESLPLKAGLVVETPPPEPNRAKEPVATSAERPVVSVAAHGSTVEKKKPAVATVTSSKPAAKQPTAVEPPQKPSPDVPEEDVAAENVEELLAAVEAMRAKRPGLRARKTAPSVEEMNRRKVQLRETVGRILASL